MINRLGETSSEIVLRAAYSSDVVGPIARDRFFASDVLAIAAPSWVHPVLAEANE